MNILLIGGPGSLLNQMIHKLSKEGHRIYLLTGSRYDERKYSKVFEKYNFPYDSTSMEEIFASVNPDVTLFLGAYDSNFSWLDEAREASRFISSLSTLLMAYSVCKRGRFVFLSTAESNDGEQNETVFEKEQNVFTYSRIAFRQAEELCETFGRMRGMDVITLRLDSLYHIPQSRDEVRNLCEKMCFEAIDTQVIHANCNHVVSMMYQDDAVEFIYKVLVCKEHQNSVYTISSNERVSEIELAEFISKGLTTTVEIVKQDLWSGDSSISGEEYFAEFNGEIFHTISSTVPRVAAQIERNRQAYETDNKKKKSVCQRLKEQAGWLVRSLIPYVENLLCFIPIVLLGKLCGDNTYFQNLDFYLLYVLLFAVIYGQQQATVSAILSIFGYFMTEKGNSSIFNILVDYSTYIWIAQLFIVGLSVGYLKDKNNRIKNEAEEEDEYLLNQLNDMTSINNSNVRVKNTLETQLVNQNDSIGKIYSITSSLDRYLPEEVWFYAAETVSQLMNTKDVAIYTVSNGDYARLASSTSKFSRKMGNSIRYREMGLVSDSILDRKVFINRTMDEKYPHMVASIYEEDEMQMIIFVWGIPWEAMNLGQANMLVVISYLIQNAVLRAKRYMSALEDKIYNAQIMEVEAFSSLVSAYRKAQDKGLTECTLLRIRTRPDDYEHAAVLLRAMMRQTDYLGLLEDGCLYALLSNTNKDDAKFVIDRFKNVYYECDVMEGLGQ